MHRTLAFFIVGLTLAILPTLTYEVLQKTAEHVGPRNALLRLSERAEQSVRWTEPTGMYVVDRTLHELVETDRFWTFTTNRLRATL